MSAMLHRETPLPSQPGHSEPVATDRLRVVYLTGSGHTGSTLMAILLQAHPRIVSVGETSIKPGIRRRPDRLAAQKCSCGSRISECVFWRRVFERVNEQGFEFGAASWNNDYRLDNPLMHRLLSRHSSYRPLRRFQNWAADHLPIHHRRMQQIDRVNVAFIRAALDAGAGDVFFDTSKRTMRLSRLLKLPTLDVKVLRLVRDVRGYTASAKRRGYSIQAASRAWKQTQRVINEITLSVPAANRLTVRYEDLCADVGATMQRLHDFIGVDNVDPFNAVNTRQHHVIGNSMRLQESIRVKLDETWRERLSATEQNQILEIAGPMNREFGYV